MTPKQAAAKLLLHSLDHGKAVSAMTREDMSAVLAERVSEIKHERIREFATKISAPFRERLGRIVGEVTPAGDNASGESAGEAAGEATGEG